MPKLAVMERLANELRDELAPFCERIEVAGSIRRGAPEPGDIELVAIARVERAIVRDGTLAAFGIEGLAQKIREINKLWEHIDAAGYEQLKQGVKYRQIVYRDGVKVDIFTAIPETWGTQMVIRTGSAAFVKSLMTRANALGFTSEGGIFRRRSDGAPHFCTTEMEVFKFLGVQWIEPEDRESIGNGVLL